MNATVPESAGATRVGQTRKLMAREETTWSGKSGAEHSNRKNYKLEIDNVNFIISIFITHKYFYKKGNEVQFILKI